MDHYDTKLAVIGASVEAVPSVEAKQDLEYPDEAPKEHQGQLRRTFKARHIQMICLGGCLGSGIFISTGKVGVPGQRKPPEEVTC